MNAPRRHSDLFTQSESGEFIIRRRLPAAWQLISLFIASYLLVFLSAYFASKIGGIVTFGIVLLAVLGPICWYVIYFAQQNRDMLMATEFQNALFSAAARLKSKFCMIAKQDGTIVYHDRNFEKVFPETTNRGLLMIDKLFSAKNIAQVEADKLYRALAENRAETVFIDINENEQEVRRVIITIDPLPRPEGFFIVRGRDYVAKKYEHATGGNDENLNAIGAKTTATMAHMLHTLPFGLYASDADGTILFANYKLESLLGYDQHEIAKRKLTLYDIIPQSNTATVEHLLLRDCEGEVHFNTRAGKQVTLHVKQEISKDANGGVIGSVTRVTQPQPGKATGSAGTTSTPVESTSLLAGKTF